MNAPWKPGLNGPRDPFAAYACDEATLDQLRPIVAEMGWATEKCIKGGLRQAVQSLSISSSPNVLLIDLSECGDPLNEIGALAEVCEPGTVVLATGHINDVRLYRDLLNSGIHDYLLKPLAPGLLRQALTNAQNFFAAPKGQDGPVGHQHIATAVIGTRGGAGASTLATSLAWIMSTDHNHPTALLDLDIHFGTGALTLDLEPGRGLTDAIDNPSRIDGLFIERAMIRANDNLAILSAETPISQPLITDGAAFIHLEEEFRHAFEMAVIDLPRSMLINFPYITAEVNVIVVVTELTLAGARDSIRILSWLKANAGQATVILVVNKAQAANPEISRGDFESSVARKVDFVVPYDLKAATNAAKLGKTFVDANGSSKATLAIREIATAIISTNDDAGKDGAAPKKKTGFMALLAKKEPKEPKKAKAPAAAK